jgi:hypothetical protein
MDMSKVSGQEAGAGSRNAAGRSVQVRIGELVLDGFAPANRLAIAEGVRRELTRLIGEQGLGRLAGPRTNAAAVDAGAFPVGPGANAAAIGGRVAQAVHRELMGGRRGK